MNDMFKRILSVALVTILVCVSALVYIGLSIGQTWEGESCYTIKCNMTRLMILLGPLSVVFYITYLKTKKELFFWLTIIPFLVLLLIQIIGRTLPIKGEVIKIEEQYQP